jgi:transposase
MLLGSTRAVKVWAWPAPVDLRRGFDGLLGLVQQQMRKDPLSGELFLFANRSRNGCKILLWDGTGLCIFQKRLARGRFANLFAVDASGAAAVHLTTSELNLFVEGATRVAAASPTEIVPKELIAKSA